MLHQRYIPAVGKPGIADSSYATFMKAPAGSKLPTILKYESVKPEHFAEVKLDIIEGIWEELPTLWNVVEGLRLVPKGKIFEVAIHTIQGASDCSGNKRIGE